MGYYKNLEAEIQDRGYGYSDKKVCAKCIGDEYISNKISREHPNRVNGVCSFCGASRNVLPLMDLFEDYIMPVINDEYDRAIDSVSWDSREGGYMEDVSTPWEFVNYELNEYLKVENDKLLEEIVDMLGSESMVSSYRFSLRQHEHNLVMWEKYCDLVRETDFSAEQIVSLMAKKDLPEEIDAIHGTLSMVYDNCKKTKSSILLRGLSSQYKADDIYRCVTYLDKMEKYYDIDYIPASLVGTPPPKKVSNNRMSEDGDMMFYGASDKRTAMEETRQDRDNSISTVGLFHTNKQFRLLDLTDIENWKLPSIFNKEKKEERNSWFFMKEFANIISKPFDDNDNNDSDDKIKFYKPTQVLTKYIQRRTGLKGIAFDSSKANGDIDSKYKNWDRTCYVLFVVNRDCLDNDAHTDSRRNQLIMQSVEQIRGDK